MTDKAKRNTLTLDRGRIYARKELSGILSLSDKKMREIIRQERKRGVPILALKTGGYKLAQNRREWEQLINDYIHRGRDELHTAKVLEDRMEELGL